MKAKLKEIYSLEVDVPLQEFFPEDPNDFGLSVRLMIGLENSTGAESFDILVCTPDWIKHQYEEERSVWGRHMLIVLEYDFDLIKTKIDRYIKSCTGDNWVAIAQQLSRIGAWEFEDYVTAS